MSQDRRQTLRVPDSRLVTEIVMERPSPASVVNLSATGLYTVKPVSSGLYGPRLVQLEIPVPEASESIWVAGDIVFEAASSGGVGTGIRFREMARFHHGLLKDIIEHRRQLILAAMLQQIKWRKELAAHPSPFAAPLPPRHEDTVRMYLLED
jgi:hypothetical protein